MYTMYTYLCIFLHIKIYIYNEYSMILRTLHAVVYVLR